MLLHYNKGGMKSEYYTSSIFRYNLVGIRDVEEAIEEGREEGRKEGILDLAKKMLAEKIDVDLISKLTGLKKEQFMK